MCFIQHNEYTILYTGADMDNKPVPDELMGLDGNQPSMDVGQDQLELSASFWSLYLESGETAIVVWVTIFSPVVWWTSEETPLNS